MFFYRACVLIKSSTFHFQVLQKPKVYRLFYVSLDYFEVCIVESNLSIIYLFIYFLSAFFFFFLQAAEKILLRLGALHKRKMKSGQPLFQIHFACVKRTHLPFSNSRKIILI